tara:strand:- start:36 stop:929 length:894 start_codon:yes stop_codon:yes gene_type:complete
MKKFISTLLVFLFYCNVSYAGCQEDLDLSLEWIGKNAALEFFWKNTNDKPIIITMHALKSKSGSYMIRSDDPIYIKPFGKKSAQLYTYDLNLDVAGNAAWNCRYSAKAVEQPKKSLNQLQKESQKSGRLKVGDSVYSSVDPVALMILLENPLSWLIIIGGGFLLFYVVRVNSQNKTKTRREKINTKKIKSIENFILYVWEGNETLYKTFWIYVFFGGIIVGILLGILGAITTQLIYLLALAYTIWSCVGLWRSSTNYKLAKIRAKQSYGWATAAKVYAVFNIITWLSQLGFILSGTV